MDDIHERNYHAVKVYHSLEKSMSFKNRRNGSGSQNALALLDVLKSANDASSIGFHDRLAHGLLSDFIHRSDIIETTWGKYIEKELSKLSFDKNSNCGVKSFSAEDFSIGKLDSPERFFLSRYSLREFKNEKVEESLIRRAVYLAMKSPSVCNRQAWHVYHTVDPIVIKNVLKYQSGNRGFGERIPNLIIIAADLAAFMPGQERSQSLIDGGMFSMSIVYALHALGVASCCLNWSQTPKIDKALRAQVNIIGSHSIIMMLAIGWPDDNNSVCASPRRPFEEIYSLLECEK